MPTWNLQTPKRQSLQAADVKSPEELSASNGAGVTRGAMVGDQSRRKREVGVMLIEQPRCRLAHGRVRASRISNAAARGGGQVGFIGTSADSGRLRIGFAL